MTRLQLVTTKSPVQLHWSCQLCPLSERYEEKNYRQTRFEASRFVCTSTQGCLEQPEYPLKTDAKLDKIQHQNTLSSCATDNSIGSMFLTTTMT
jgi:hypothetical protein